MILIPTWALLTLVSALECILFYLYLTNKEQTIGRLSGALLLPVFFVFVMYAMVEFVSLENARIMARYAFGVLFFAMIMIFGRLAWRYRK